MLKKNVQLTQRQSADDENLINTIGNKHGENNSSSVDGEEETEELNLLNEDELNKILHGIYANNQSSLLDLTNFNLTTAQKIKIFKALSSNSSVQEANFSGTNFNDTDCEIFASLITNNVTLKTLNLSYNKFSSEGLKYLITMNSAINKLFVICNNLGNSGAEVVAKYAKIPFINLTANGITDLMVDALLDNKNLNNDTYASLLISNNIKNPTKILCLLKSSQNKKDSSASTSSQSILNKIGNLEQTLNESTNKSEEGSGKNCEVKERETSSSKKYVVASSPSEFFISNSDKPNNNKQSSDDSPDLRDFNPN